jgi:hypothetical protein
MTTTAARIIRTIIAMPPHIAAERSWLAPDSPRGAEDVAPALLLESANGVITVVDAPPPAALRSLAAPSGFAGRLLSTITPSSF